MPTRKNPPRNLTSAVLAEVRLRFLLETSIADPILTALANAVVSLIHSAESLLKLVNTLISTTGGIFSDFLHLHRVESRQAANRNINSDSLRINLLISRLSPQILELFSCPDFQFDLLVDSQHPLNMQHSPRQARLPARILATILSS